MKNGLIELLAPAGNIDIAKAALDCGADACYIGGKWSARAYAKNFTDDEVREIADYAHLRNKKIYVALNTMLYEDELEKALEYSSFLDSIGIDAVIASDLGYIDLVKKYIPSLEIHASTQMGIGNSEAARFLLSKGFTRAVAQRECSLSELKSIAATGIEVEAFCHGAMCSGVSGACLLSGMVSDRSGNRGKCAQLCRQLYSLNGVQKAYHLSTRDMCTAGIIKDFIDAGIASLKIEGRMKNINYVVNTVSGYRRIIDSVYAGINIDTEAIKDDFLVSFNRGGFSEGYFRQKKNLLYTAKSTHMGMYLGRLSKDKKGLKLVTSYKIRPGDSIEINGEGFAVSPNQLTDGGLYVTGSEYRPGDSVYLKASVELQKRLDELIEKSRARIPAGISLELQKNNILSVAAWYGDKRASKSEKLEEKAKNPPNTERIADQLKKTGNTVFEITDCSVKIDGDAYIAVKTINSLRRDALNELERLIIEDYRKDAKAIEYEKASKAYESNRRVLCAEVSTFDNLMLCRRLGFERIYFAPVSSTEFENYKNSDVEGIYIVLPSFISEKTADFIRKNDSSRIKGYVCPNLSALCLARELGRDTVADYSMNIANSSTAEFLKAAGCDIMTVSAEIDSRRIEEISCVDKEAVVYGKVRLMTLYHNFDGKIAGGKGNILSNDLGYSFPVGNLWLGEGYAELRNGLPAAVKDFDRMRACGITSARLIFTDESPEEIEKITEYYMKGYVYGSPENDDSVITDRYTKGKFYRGVE